MNRNPLIPTLLPNTPLPLYLTNMGWFSDDSAQADAYDQITQRPHEASWSHELIAGAAAFEAAKAYENHVAENGQPDDHATAKELLAGFVGAFLDREVETKGLDWYDRERAERQAQEHAESALLQNSNYGGNY
ncbi:unnamed protein product [Rhizoctonia solani]|uniref:CipC protein n=3 Tax=Rhizoctonia solani TaxID=456999 RepID=A0A8H2WSI5_9AGAM|nr:CipC protein, putative [Rhizoctonia solani AG-3 Rhs1AP]KEP50378.1 putative CipC protein [Rhizoctonia solani 123E]CAE6404113.1 unnamed protein product [Rhizoctonia solani]